MVSHAAELWYNMGVKKERLFFMSASYTYWQDSKDGLWLGYWNDYPEYPTQGHDIAELQLMLRDIRDAIRDGDLVVDSPRNIGVMDYA